MKITLSLWDIGGQERFEFFKTDFFKGTAAVGLVFDISRPDTLQYIDNYVSDIRKENGNIPIILIGNKFDLKKDVGETVYREEIIQKIHKENFVEYIEVSAKTNKNVEKLFKKLAIVSLADIRPRLGEIIDMNNFRFKILLLGDAGVGKSSLLKSFFNEKLDNNYKLTIGLDLLRRDFNIPNEEIPIEIQELLKSAAIASRRRLKVLRKKDKISKSEDLSD
ncbi:MAG TPA: GTP-binding protein [Candidatus Lokiarchaeia archaeon]